MEIVLIRHGQTDLNKTAKVQGSRIDLLLNAAGRAGAVKSAAHFDPTQFSACFVSPLKRAKQTAQIFTKNTLPLHEDARLKEMDYGSWDGEKVADLMKKYPDGFDAWGNIVDDYAKHATGGESFADLKKRTLAFVHDLQKKYDQDKVLVVSHGATIRTLSAALLNSNPEAFQQMHNCGLTKFSIKNGVARLVYYDHVL
jgi:broad specificity phosphatase PhoE